MLQQTMTLGRIAAIPVRLHWSSLLLSGMLTASLSPVYAARVCEQAMPCSTAWGLALLMAALIGLSVLLHELGHAMVARFCAMPVEGITLFAFGGMAEMRSEIPGPRQEFVIAMAGPAVSLLIALAATLLWWAIGRFELLFQLSLGLSGLLALHLAMSNGIMVLFSMLPGYPMDGGRVLRATLWFLNDDLLPATRMAARIGRIVAGSLVLIGLALALTLDQPALAAWTALIGFFLHATARSHERQLLIHTALYGMRVADLMQQRIRTATADLTIEQFVSHYLLGQSESGFAIVIPESRPETAPMLLGMLSLRQVRRFRSSDWPRMTVAEAMIPADQLAVLTPATSALDGLHCLNAARDELLPVVAEGRLVGMLTRRDLAVFIQVQLARRQP